MRSHGATVRPPGAWPVTRRMPSAPRAVRPASETSRRATVDPLGERRRRLGTGATPGRVSPSAAARPRTRTRASSQSSRAASSATTAAGSAPQPFIDRPGIGLNGVRAGGQQRLEVRGAQPDDPRLLVQAGREVAADEQRGIAEHRLRGARPGGARRRPRSARRGPRDDFSNDGIGLPSSLIRSPGGSGPSGSRATTAASRAPCAPGAARLRAARTNWRPTAATEIAVPGRGAGAPDVVAVRVERVEDVRLRHPPLLREQRVAGRLEAAHDPRVAAAPDEEPDRPPVLPDRGRGDRIASWRLSAPTTPVGAAAAG